jgi:DNA-binding response OmpR family regulator
LLPAGDADSMKLLIVDDDRMLAELVRRAFVEEGHAVDVVHDGTAAKTLAFVNAYDVIVLDVTLPGTSGLAIVRELRAEERTTPVLLLTGAREPEDIVHGLDTGADDYLTKPFELDVLKARVRALGRRRGAVSRSDQVAFGDIVLDRRRRRAHTMGRALQMTPREFALLEYLMLHAERVVTRTELLEKVWDLNFDPGSNVVDVHVARLRNKLRQAGATLRLDTIRGVGFALTISPREFSEGTTGE